MVSTSHSEWWLAAVPTQQTVSVAGANPRAALPHLHAARSHRRKARRQARELPGEHADHSSPQETIDSGTDSSFPLPPEMVARPTGNKGKPGKGKRRRFSARLATAGAGKRVVVRGQAPKGLTAEDPPAPPRRARGAQADGDGAASLGRALPRPEAGPLPRRRPRAQGRPRDAYAHQARARPLRRRAKAGIATGAASRSMSSCLSALRPRWCRPWIESSDLPRCVGDLPRAPAGDVPQDDDLALLLRELGERVAERQRQRRRRAPRGPRRRRRCPRTASRGACGCGRSPCCA